MYSTKLIPASNNNNDVKVKIKQEKNDECFFLTDKIYVFARLVDGLLDSSLLTANNMIECLNPPNKELIVLEKYILPSVFSSHINISRSFIITWNPKLKEVPLYVFMVQKDIKDLFAQLVAYNISKSKTLFVSSNQPEYNAQQTSNVINSNILPIK